MPDGSDSDRAPTCCRSSIDDEIVTGDIVAFVRAKEEDPCRHLGRTRRVPDWLEFVEISTIPSTSGTVPVSIVPGEIVFTRGPLGANSIAHVFDSATTAAFVPQ